MMVQNMVWLEWPPPLLRTTLRMSSGTGVQVADEVVNGFRGQVGVVGQRGIHVVDVGLVVLVVVQLHGLRVDERLEGGVVVRKRCKFVCHRGNLLSWDCTVSVEGHRRVYVDAPGETD